MSNPTNIKETECWESRIVQDHKDDVRGEFAMRSQVAQITELKNEQAVANVTNGSEVTSGTIKAKAL